MSAKVPPKPAASKPGKDTVYIDADDEITSIIDKVENAEQKVVALVLPKRATTLQSTVNMRLLKRSSTTAGKNVVLITSESALLPLAGAAGLHVAKNLQSKPEIPPHPKGDLLQTEAEAPVEDIDGGEELDTEPQKLDYSSSVGALATPKDEEPEVVPLGDDDAPGEKPAHKATKPSKSRGLKVPNFDRFRLILGLGIAAFIAFIVFIILAITVLPKAKVTIETSSTPVSLNTELTASGTAKSLDEDKKIIPSVLKTSDQTASQTVQATGQQNQGDKASGSVSMTAQKCAGNPFVTPDDVPAGTGISSGGVGFITKDKTSFHGTGVSGSCYTYASNGGTDIVAQSAGTKYNISGATFSVPGRSDVSASGSTSGGTDNNVKILTQQDVDGAKAKITSADSDKFSKDFQSQLSDQGFYVLTSTLKIGDPALSSTPAVGQQTDSASVNVKITYSVLAVQKSDLEKFVSGQLNTQIDQKKEKISDNDVLDNLNINVQNQQANSANASLTLSKDTTAVPIIDVNAVKQNAKGKKESEIKNYVNTYPGVKSVDVHLSPFWISHAPGKVSKITVVQKQVKVSQSGQ
jgi:hypothetical protein